MLEFSASKYVELSHQFGLMLGRIGNQSPDPDSWGDSLGQLMKDASALGLIVTREHFNQMILEFVRANPGKAAYENGQFRIKDASIDPHRFCYHIESVYSTMKAELGAVLLKAIPKERAKYSNSDWLKDSAIEFKFPTSFKEIERAGRCYAFGQPTAAVFHGMRALEPALAALAAPFKVASAHENWQNIIEQIEKKVRAIGLQPKSQQKIENEKFFGNATSHLYFVKNAWRNHVAHTRDSYSDDEALKIIQHSLEFVESLCPRLAE